MQYVAYYRVSKASRRERDDGKASLGLDAQRHSVLAHIACEPIAEFTECESGKRDKNRPELRAALAMARKHRATLVIAKLDRLSRNAAFLMTLRESAVNLIACDMPNVSTLEFGIRAVIAQHERETISQRTKDALAALKREGKKLGVYGAILAQRHKDSADEYARSIADRVTALRQDHKTVRALCAALNAAHVPTSTGGQWHVTSTQKLVKRLETLT